MARSKDSTSCLAFTAFFTIYSVLWTGCARQDEVPDRQAFGEHVVDIGVKWVGADCTYPIDIENTTSKSLGVRSFMTSCQCASISPASFVIPPYETTKVLLDIDTSIPLHKLEQKLSVSIIPLLENGTALPRTRLVGTILNPVASRKSQFDLGDLRPGRNGIFHRAFVTTLQTQQACYSIKMRFDSNKMTCRLEKNLLSATQYTLIVNVAPDLSAGEYYEAVRLTCSCNGEYGQCPPRDIYFSWRVLPRTIVIPRTLALGLLSTNGDTSERVAFKSPDNTALHVTALPPAIKGVSVSRVPLENAFRVHLNARELEPSANRIDLYFDASIGRENVKEQLVVPVLFQVPSLPVKGRFAELTQ